MNYINHKNLINEEIYYQRETIHNNIKKLELQLKRIWGTELIYSLPVYRLAGDIEGYLGRIENKRGVIADEIRYLLYELQNLYRYDNDEYDLI